MKPSCERVLAALRANPHGLTPQTAREEAGCDRLAARVSDLKAMGYVIETRLIVVPTRGGGARVASYVLHEPEPVQLLAWSA